MLDDIGFFIAFVSHKFSYLDFFLVYSVESLHNIGKLYIERNTFLTKKWSKGQKKYWQEKGCKLLDSLGLKVRHQDLDQVSLVFFAHSLEYRPSLSTSSK